MDYANIFNPGNELFSKAAMTGYVNTQPFVPEFLGKWLPWNVQNETLRQMIIEFNEGKLAIVPEAPVGAPGYTPEDDDRSAVPVLIPHYPQKQTLWAKSLEGIRAVGSELEETLTERRNRLLNQINRNNRVRWEIARIGAITGLVLDQNGNIKHNWFNTFGTAVGQPLVQTTHDIDFSNANTKLRSALIDARDKGEEQLGDLTATAWVAVCGKNRFKSITDHASFEKMFDRYNDSSMLRDDVGIDGFQVASDIRVVKYSRATVAGVKLIGDDDMYLCPVADDMYRMHFGPGTGFADLGAAAYPEYVSPHFLPHDEGVEFKAQTNVLAYATRLGAIVKIEQA